MKLYLSAVGLIVFTIAIFGFVLPFLISAASTELVLFGWAILILYPVVAYKLVLSIYNQIKAKVAQNEVE